MILEPPLASSEAQASADRPAPVAQAWLARRGTGQKVSAMLDWFLPPDFPRNRQPQMRARLLIIIAPLIGIGSILWTLGLGFGLGLARPPYPGVIAVTLLSGTIAVLPLLLKRGWSLPGLCTALVAVVLAQSATIWFVTGGQISQFLQIVPVGLVIACFVLGLRGGICTGLAVAAMVCGMVWLQWADLVPPPRVSADMQEVIGYYRAAIAALGALLVTASVAHTNDRMEESYARAREAAEAGNRARSAFLANVSHDLRTPVTGMLGSIALLEGSALDHQQRGWLSALRSSTEALSTILNDLLDMARDGNGMRHRRTPVSPTVLVEEVVTLFRAQAATKGIWLRLELDPDLPAQIAVNGAALRQVLINLTGNAINATDRGGVTLAARCLKGSYGLLLMVTVRDTGHGFDAESHPLPGPASARTQADAGAHGAGLAICERLVTAMGGRLEAFGMTEAGASFRVTLPVERLGSALAIPARRMDPPMAVADQGPGKGRNILVAEDSDTNRMLLGALLERIGHRPHLVADGTAALAAIRAAERQPGPQEAMAAAADSPLPDLLLLDIQMPGLTGTEVARAVRLVPGPLQAVPILGLTADATPEHRQGYLDAGMNELLYKPVRLQELQEAIDRLVDRPGSGYLETASRGALS